jgi:hypothetical protein
MTNVQIVVPEELLRTLRTLKGDSDDSEEDNALRTAVAELLALAPGDPAHEKEYGFRVTLRAVARVGGTSKAEALGKLAEFQSVDCNIPYEDVTITEASFVPEDVTLIDIDGGALDGR